MSDKKVEDLTLLTLLPVDKLLAALDVESATLWSQYPAALQVVYVMFVRHPLIDRLHLNGSQCV